MIVNEAFLCNVAITQLKKNGCVITANEKISIETIESTLYQNLKKFSIKEIEVFLNQNLRKSLSLFLINQILNNWKL